MTNWKKTININTVQVLRGFANNQLPKNTALELLAFQDGYGEFRNLVRTQGSDKARVLTKRALLRRGL